MTARILVVVGTLLVVASMVHLLSAGPVTHPRRSWAALLACLGGALLAFCGMSLAGWLA